MCSLLGGWALWLLCLSLTFVWCLSPHAVGCCLSVVPGECRGAETGGATCEVDVRSVFAPNFFWLSSLGGTYQVVHRCGTRTYLKVIPCVFPL